MSCGRLLEQDYFMAHYFPLSPYLLLIDNHLPNVEYEIRLQKILNEFFVVLMLLVLEAMTVYVMRTYHEIPGSWTKALDWITGLVAVLHNIRLTALYYVSKQRAKHNLEQGWKTKAEKVL